MTDSLLLRFIALVSLAGSPAVAALDFNRDIRPILSENCFSCHGFDAKSRKGDLRLDTPEGAFAVNDGVQAIKPGDPVKSAIMERMLTQDQDELMPPPESHKKLTAQQIATLRQWIAEGAVYKKHWSFEPPVKVAGASSLDALVEKRLAQEKLTFSTEAKSEQLIRRVTLDLTGLPPTVAEVDAFLADISGSSADKAYDRLVERLLQSPHYGEHMGRYWLDAARYGDTHGLHLDNERSLWPYRDWVVQAFNDNVPFNTFTEWQLAGDLLPNATREQQIASGFNRCNVTTSEGGSINEEWVHRYAIDRTETTVAVWMGLTAGCAVCHDHKYDPLTTKEFYSLYSFFNSTADPAMDGNILLTPPILRLSTPAQEAEIAKLDASIKAAESKLKQQIASLKYEDPATLNPKPSVTSSQNVWFEDGFPVGAKPEHTGAPTTFVTKAQGPVSSGERALKRTGKGVDQDFFAGGVKLDVPPGGRITVDCYIDPANPPKSIMVQFHTGGWNHRAVWGDEGAIPFGKVRTTERAYLGALPEKGKWVTLQVNLDRIGLKPGMKVTGFAFTQYDGTVYWDKLAMHSRVDPANDPAWSWSKWVEKNQGKRVEGLPNDLQTLVRGKKAADWGAADTKRVQDWWFENEYQGARGMLDANRAEKLALEQKKKSIEDAVPATLIMADMPQKRDAFVMQRGQYDKPGDKVSRTTPAFLPPLSKKQGDYTRLDLARWLVSPQHPLTARVQVNRLWQQFFGVGLVKSSNDFGSQGEPPSHPELLDWLAITFQEQDWDVKRLVKQLVTSRTYRQSSVISPALLERDPENRLMARGPRFRLDGEVLRDQALAFSGLLVPTLGGKGVKPYQPENIWEPVAYSGSNTRYYVQDHGDALYRRSLYTFIKRTAPAPAMTNFDGPSREATCSRRERSNTPMQALQLMNDIQHVEAARHFGHRILKEGGKTDDSRLSFAWRSATGRFPTAEESRVMERALAQFRQRYATDAAAATKLISFGESPAPKEVPAPELAAWTMLANLVMNLDEVVTR